MPRPLRFTVEGETFDYNGKLMLPEAIVLQKVTGWTKQEWAEQFDRGDVIAQAVLLWLLHKRRNPGQPLEFAEFDYDTNDVDVAFLKRDGSPMDMPAVGKRINELVEGGLDKAEAVTQALDEADPAPGAQEPENPTVAAGTVAAAEPVPTSPPSSPATPQPSPTTSESVPGSLTG